MLLVGSDEPQSLGQIELARFINPAGLRAVGHNLLVTSVASGLPIVGVPGQDGRGKIDQGALEVCTGQVLDEVVKMIITQRAYEIKSKAIQKSEEMAQIANNLKRS